ncbi:hypothetical protein CDD82_6026 [Ophiocordyceps australis]|uniref:Protein disulfide-isomerase n=1 Tax=Ophiocordyceps australis TaxID=1399860 RepID=A0A2C5YZJ2_9HYPO|nr:hypothetical protein CDD82_6026 [Ophiocordyceps australis]
MKSLLMPRAALGLALLAAAGHATTWKHSDAAALRQQMAQNEHTLVAFVASETQSTKALLPEWNAVDDGEVPLSSVNCSTADALCAQLDVVSFPAIRLYRRNKPMVRYRGPRKALSIVSFLQRIKRPVVSHLSNNDGLDDFLASDGVVVVAHLGSHDGSLLARFSSLADTYHDRYSFGLVSHEPGAANFVQCRNNMDAMEHEQSQVDRAGDFERFLSKCAEPLVPELSRRTELQYAKTGKSLVYYLSDDETWREAQARIMNPLAKQYGDYLQFVTVDSAEYPELPRNLGLAARQGLVVENRHTGDKFPYPSAAASALDVNAVAQFIDAIAQGSVMPWKGHEQYQHDEL